MEKEITLNKTTKDKFIDYITYFFIYALLGWCIVNKLDKSKTTEEALRSFQKEIK